MLSLYCVSREGMGRSSRLFASTFSSPPGREMECTQLFQVKIQEKKLMESKKSNQNLLIFRRKVF